MSFISKISSPFRPPTKAENRGASDPRESIPAGFLTPARVLVLDDDVFVLELMRRIQETRELNFTLTVCETMRQAEAALNTTDGGAPPFDVIIFDVALANGNGIDLYARLLKKWPGLNVVFLTGYASEDVLQRVERVGPARVHSKMATLRPDFLVQLLKACGVKSNI